jgi:hypothetical protein
VDDLLFLLCMVGCFGMSIAFWVARGGEIFERPVLVRRARATTVAMLALMLGSLVASAVVVDRPSTTGGWVILGACAGVVLAIVGAAVAVAKERLWPPPDFPEKVEVAVRPPGTPRPLGGAHAAARGPLWSARRYARQPSSVLGGVILLVAAGIALGALCSVRGNTVGLVLCGLGVVCVLAAVGLHSPSSVLLAWAGIVAASVSTFVGWFGPIALVLSLVGMALAVAVYERPADELVG